MRVTLEMARGLGIAAGLAHVAPAGLLVVLLLVLGLARCS